jgi:hypothetical protein
VKENLHDIWMSHSRANAEKARVKLTIKGGLTNYEM